MSRLVLGARAAAAGVLVSVSFAALPSFAAPEATPAAAVVTAVEKICLPLVSGQGLQTIAASTGLEQRDGGWVERVEGKKQIRISPPGRANPNICTGEVLYDRDGQAPILAALDAWAQSKNLTKGKAREESKGSDLQYRASSWFGPAPNGGTAAVVFTEQRELDGRSLAGDLDQAMLVVSVSR